MNVNLIYKGILLGFSLVIFGFYLEYFFSTKVGFLIAVAGMVLVGFFVIYGNIQIIKKTKEQKKEIQKNQNEFNKRKQPWQ